MQSQIQQIFQKLYLNCKHGNFYIYDYKFYFNIGSYIYVSVHLGFPLKIETKKLYSLFGFFCEGQPWQN